MPPCAHPESSIASRGIESKHHLARARWVVERTLVWFTKAGRIEHCHEWRIDIQPAFHEFAAGLICWNYLHWYC